MNIAALQTALRLIYPPRCTSCGVQVDSEFGLCGTCWRDTPFISGLCCDSCGVPLPGEDTGEAEICDECLRTPRPWDKGRAALIYKDRGRQLVLALKHGDRHEVLHPAAKWMARAAQPLLTDNMLIAPIPLHWFRMMKRTYNQAALLSTALAREVGHAHCPDLLQRRRQTPSLNGLGYKERFATLDAAITVHPKRKHRIAGRDVLLVDDVMTSGATLSAATQACHGAGASRVRVLTLARVVKDG